MRINNHVSSERRHNPQGHIINPSNARISCLIRSYRSNTQASKFRAFKLEYLVPEPFPPKADILGSIDALDDGVGVLLAAEAETGVLEDSQML